ncbi:MAG: PD-(D/E)XK nuclease family protein [Deltaproteobacteria bacterium]|nr:PD-(D/E)XK nuclease family protein [Deltaproteobacteria bacterium]
MGVVVLVGRTREQRRRALAPVAGLDSFQRPDFLYLTATRRKADVVRAAWWDQPDKPPTFLPDARPWGAFRDDLATRWGEGRALLGPVARELLAGAVFRGLQPRFRVWGGLRDGPETRRALAAFAEDWGHGFTGDAPPPLGDEPYSLRFPGEPDHTWGPLFATTSAVGPALRQDAWFFLRSWRRALRNSGAWTDRPGFSRALLAALRSPSAQLLGSLRAWRGVIVDDLLWLPPLDRAVLKAFVAAYREARPEGTVHLCLEAPTAGDQDTVRAWLAGEEHGEGLEVTRELREDWASWLPEGRLALADDEPHVEDLSDLVVRDAVVEDAAAACGGVRVRGYPSVQAEVRGIARTLKAELLGGRPADEMFVSFPDLDRYAPLVRDVFSAYGIPFVVEKGEELLHSPPGSAARQLLRLATTPAEPSSLRSLLASGWIRAWFTVDRAMVEPLVAPLKAALGSRFEAVHAAVLETVVEQVTVRADLERLHPIVVTSGARGAPRDWLPDIAAWRLRKADDQLARSRGDASRIERIEGRLTRDLCSYVVEVLALERLLEALAPLSNAPTARDAAQRFEELLGSMGIRASEPGPDLDRVRTRAMRANGAAIEALTELVRDVAGSLEGVEAAAPGAFGRSGAASLLRDAVEEAVRRTRYRAAGPRVGVQIVGLRDLHGADVPWLWVGGLTDGAFPRGPRPDFLLPRTVPSLVPGIDRADEDRAIFASLLRSAGHGVRRASSRIVLSWPRSEGGRDVVPSPLVADLRALRTSEGTLADWWTVEQTTAEASLPPLLSRDELLTRPDLCEQLPASTALPADDPLADPTADVEGPALLTAADRKAMGAWDELVAARGAEDGFGAWDGVLGMDRPWRPQALGWLREVLGVKPGRQGRATLSLRTTGLERWVKCPIRFFFESVLGLEEPRPFAMEPGRDESGTLVHEVLEHFLAERIAAKAAGTIPSSALWTMGVAERERAERRLRELALQIAGERLAHRSGPWVDRLVEDLVAGLPGSSGSWLGPLARFLGEETRGHFLDAEPAHVEWTFEGLSPASAAYRLSPKDSRDPLFRVGTGDVDVRLRGSIDRVDLPARRSYGGRPRGDGGLRAVVYDYKTGYTPFVDDVDKGLQLQPAVYPMAIDVPWYASGLVSGYWELRSDVGRQRRRLAISSRLRRYLMDQRGLSRPIGFRYTTHEVTMWAWRAWLMRTDWYGQLVASGVFPPTLHKPKVAGCQYCPFRRACRTEPVRTERVLNPPPNADGRTPPVFWPASVSVWEGLDAMFGARGGGEPDEEPEAPEDDGVSIPQPAVVLPAPGPPSTDEFDDFFDGDMGF